MQIIPVIDLMSGQVVHAKQGMRDQYRPINSLLCTSSEPLAVVSALLELYPFETLYIADIDAIRGVSHHHKIIETLSKQFPKLTVWLDNGGNIHALNSNPIIPVIGTESLHELADYQKIASKQHILSLDYLAQRPLGLSALHYMPNAWPDITICMTLNNVGSSAGVDTTTLMDVHSRNRSRNIPAKLYAAGGVRDKTDLQQLAKQGITGALVASALHNRKISTEDLEKLMS